MSTQREREAIGLPPRFMMFTPDQIAMMLEVKEKYVRDKLLFYDVREPGLRPGNRLRAINIAPEGEKPEWRVSEREFIRYLRGKGVKFYTRGFGM